MRLINADELTKVMDCYIRDKDKTHTAKFVMTVAKDMVMMQKTEDVTAIFENMTNGDVQKLILSDFEFENLGDVVIGKRYYPYCKVQFDMRWWNSLYEGGNN